MNFKLKILPLVATNFRSFLGKWLCDKHPQRDSIAGPRTLQSGMLPLDHCDLRQDVDDLRQNLIDASVGVRVVTFPEN